MTKRLLLFFTIILFFLTLPAKAQLWLGEVAHWDFNGSVLDVSGHGHHGTPTNITSAAGKDGSSNSAYYFDGTGYVSVPFHANLNINEFSIAAIIKPTEFYTGQCQGNAVVIRGTQGQNGNYGLLFTDNPYDFEDYTHYDTNYYVFEPLTGQTTFNSANYQYTPTIRTNTWYTVIVTYGNGEARVFVDGVLKSVTPILSGFLGNSTDGIYIGKNVMGGTTFPYPFKGYIDDIRLYNRVLPDSDIIAYSRKLYIKPPFNDTFLCVGKSFNLEYTCKQPFIPGNVFTAQLSDPIGSFTAPINIGSITAYNSGSIPCTIPANISLGAGYRIRILATNQVDTSLDNGKNIYIQNTYAIPTLTGNSPVCEGSDTIKLKVKSTPTATIYIFRGPGITGGIIGDSMSLWAVKPNYAGNYIVESNYRGCSAFDTFTIAVKPQPTATSIKDSIKLCTGDSLHLSGTSNTAGASFKWAGPDTMSAMVPDTTIYNVSKKNAGIYTIRAYFNGCVSVADTTYAIVSPRPVPIISSNAPVCEGDSLYFRVSDTMSAAVKYSWTGPGNFTSAARDTFILNPMSANSGHYIITARSPKNCIATDGTDVYIKPLPIKPELSNNSPLCSNNTLELNGVSTTGTTWSWTGPNGFNSTEQNPKISNVPMANSGTYRAIVSLDGCTRTDTTKVVVNLTPDEPKASSNSPLLIGQELKLYCNTSTPGVNYKWTGPNGFGSYAQEPIVTRATTLASGTYIVTVTLGNCSSSALTIVLVRNESILDTFVLYPNPNNGDFTLMSNAKVDGAMPLEIVNEIGQIIHRDMVYPVNNQLKKEINIQGAVRSGVYTLRIIMDGKSRIVKFTLIR